SVLRRWVPSLASNDCTLAAGSVNCREERAGREPRPPVVWSAGDSHLRLASAQGRARVVYPARPRPRPPGPAVRRRAVGAAHRSAPHTPGCCLCVAARSARPTGAALRGAVRADLLGRGAALAMRRTRSHALRLALAPPAAAPVGRARGLGTGRLGAGD